MMKGQYRIISEMILFAIGIMIMAYVIINFTNVENTIQRIAVEDQLNGIADVVATGIVRASIADNTTIRLEIPTKLSDKRYKISLKDVDGGKLILTTLDLETTVERQLFNINHDNIIDGNNVINNSEVVSTAQYIVIIKNEKITLDRLT